MSSPESAPTGNNNGYSPERDGAPKAPEGVKYTELETAYKIESPSGKTKFSVDVARGVMKGLARPNENLSIHNKKEFNYDQIIKERGEEGKPNYVIKRLEEDRKGWLGFRKTISDKAVMIVDLNDGANGEESHFAVVSVKLQGNPPKVDERSFGEFGRIYTQDEMKSAFEGKDTERVGKAERRLITGEITAEKYEKESGRVYDFLTTKFDPRFSSILAWAARGAGEHWTRQGKEYLSFKDLEGSAEFRDAQGMKETVLKKLETNFHEAQQRYLQQSEQHRKYVEAETQRKIQNVLRIVNGLSGTVPPDRLRAILASNGLDESVISVQDLIGRLEGPQKANQLVMEGYRAKTEEADKAKLAAEEKARLEKERADAEHARAEVVRQGNEGMAEAWLEVMDKRDELDAKNYELNQQIASMASAVRKLKQEMALMRAKRTGVAAITKAVRGMRRVPTASNAPPVQNPGPGALGGLAVAGVAGGGGVEASPPESEDEAEQLFAY